MQNVYPCVTLRRIMDNNDLKKFAEWVILKENLHKIGSVRSFREGEIWWAALGENIGIEINGKNEVFSRPVLVFRKFGPEGFLAVPLTSQTHTGIWYTNFIHNNTLECALLSQIRVLSVHRLYRKIGKIQRDDYMRVSDDLKRLYFRE